MTSMIETNDVHVYTQYWCGLKVFMVTMLNESHHSDWICIKIIQFLISRSLPPRSGKPFASTRTTPWPPSFNDLPTH